MTLIKRVKGRRVRGKCLPQPINEKQEENETKKLRTEGGKKMHNRMGEQGAARKQRADSLTRGTTGYQVHTHQGTRMYDRGRGGTTRVMRKAAPLIGRGILFTWGSNEKVCTYLLRATIVRDYKTLSSITRNKPTTSRLALREGGW